MAITIRLSRGGRKNRPHYSIVVADSRMPRDGRFIEKLGTYNPLLAKDDERRVTLNNERITYWLGEGAKTSERVASFLGKAGLAPMPTQRKSVQKALPKAKAQERLAEKEEKAKAAEESKKQAEEEAKTAAEAPAEETPAEAPAEESKSEDAPVEEAASEDKKDA